MTRYCLSEDGGTLKLTAARWHRKKGARPCSLEVLEWVAVAGRGTVAVVAPPDDGTLADPAALLGRHVLLDGKEWLVAGVEKRAAPHGGQAPRHPFGLLVKRAPGVAAATS